MSDTDSSKPILLWFRQDLRLHDHPALLAAVDEGDESVQALRWCLGTFAAAARGDTVILLYVRPAPPTYSVLDASGKRHLSALFQHPWPAC